MSQTIYDRIRNAYPVKGTWSEQDHPRADSGQFGSGGGGGDESTDKPTASARQDLDALENRSSEYQQNAQTMALTQDYKTLEQGHGKLMADLRTHIEGIKSELKDSATEKELVGFDKAVGKELAKLDKFAHKLTAIGEKQRAAVDAYDEAEADSKDEEEEEE